MEIMAGIIMVTEMDTVGEEKSININVVAKEEKAIIIGRMLIVTKEIIIEIVIGEQKTTIFNRGKNREKSRSLKEWSAFLFVAISNN
jgi:hypothetical protein